MTHPGFRFAPPWARFEVAASRLLLPKRQAAFYQGKFEARDQELPPCTAKAVLHPKWCQGPGKAALHPDLLSAQEQKRKRYEQNANRKDPPRSCAGGSFRLAVGIGLRLSTLRGPSGRLLELRVLRGFRAEALSLSHLTWDTTMTVRFHIFLDHPPFQCMGTITRLRSRRQIES